MLAGSSRSSLALSIAIGRRLLSALDGFDRVVVDRNLDVDTVALQEVLELVQVVV
jgi:hypothetical protein